MSNLQGNGKYNWAMWVLTLLITGQCALARKQSNERSCFSVIMKYIWLSRSSMVGWWLLLCKKWILFHYRESFFGDSWFNLIYFVWVLISIHFLGFDKFLATCKQYTHKDNHRTTTKTRIITTNDILFVTLTQIHTIIITTNRMELLTMHLNTSLIPNESRFSHLEHGSTRILGRVTANAIATVK